MMFSYFFELSFADERTRAGGEPENSPVTQQVSTSENTMAGNRPAAGHRKIRKFSVLRASLQAQ
jgi:hypothetical protein